MGQSTRSRRDSAVKISMGIEPSMLLRLEQPLHSQLKLAYQRLYRGLKPPHFSAFVGYCAAVGLDQLKATHLENGQARRKR